MPETTQTRFYSGTVGADSMAEDKRLRTLRRLRQLAGEIETALKRADMSLVHQASGLLAPALAAWAEACSPNEARNPEIALLTQEVGAALQDCENALNRAMSDVQKQQSQVRQHQQRVRQARSHKRALPGAYSKALNISR